MRTILFVCALAFSGLSMADVASNQTSNTTPYPDQEYYYGQFDMNGAMGMIASVQAQQHMSQHYGNLLLDIQAAYGWMQVAHGWLATSSMETQARSLEEDQDFEEEDEGAQHDQLMQTERMTEMTLLYVLKIMYLQAGQKLNSAHQSHYQTKIALAVMNQAGAGQNTAIAGVLQMLYYLEAIKLMRSVFVIQRQDAWNTWLLHEIMETDEFKKSALPDTFELTMKNSRAIAMELYYTETMFDMQVMLMEYWVQSYIMQLMYAAGSYAVPQQNSFLEVEAEAEPSKPFFPYMGYGEGNGYMGYWMYYLRWFAIIMNMQAAHGLMMHAQIDLHPEADSTGKYAAPMKQYAVYALQQWAYLRVIEVMMEMYGLFTGTYVKPHTNAAASSFVQTDATADAPKA